MGLGVGTQTNDRFRMYKNKVLIIDPILGLGAVPIVICDYKFLAVVITPFFARA